MSFSGNKDYIYILYNTYTIISSISGILDSKYTE